MIPNTDMALRMLAQRLMVQLLPDLGTAYSQSDGMLIGVLMNAIADEAAEGIDRRMKDIEEMQSLMEDAGLPVEFSRAAPESLRLADVNALHDRLTKRLIELHAQAEAESDAAQCDVIWGYLRRHAERHRITAAG